MTPRHQHRWCAGAAALLLMACAHADPHRDVAPAMVGVSIPASCEGTRLDADHDGLDDGCEYALAEAFAPLLVGSPRDCIWTAEARAPLAGGYLFAARRAGTGVRLAYLPAYARDCGWRDMACLRPGGRCGAHTGDSELILLDVAPREDGQWMTTGVFLSAHCLGGRDARCRWYRGSALGEFDWVSERAGGAPRVWVARDKHAHYPSAAACRRGHWGRERCDRPGASFRFPVLTAAQNIGSRAFPRHGAGGCVSALGLPAASGLAAATGVECVWDVQRAFRGWQGDEVGPSPTAYGALLHWFGGF